MALTLYAAILIFALLLVGYMFYQVERPARAPVRIQKKHSRADGRSGRVPRNRY